MANVTATGKSVAALLFLLTLIACARQRPATGPFPNPLTTDSEWIAYEGILRNGNGQDVHVELDGRPAREHAVCDRRIAGRARRRSAVTNVDREVGLSGVAAVLERVG